MCYVNSCCCGVITLTIGLILCLICDIFFYISLSYARGGIVRTFKGPLKGGERKLKRNEWDMV